MSKHLVIVESPAKAKSINKYLGDEYTVMASVGHIRDLPPKNLGVNVEESFLPEYVETDRGKKIIKELKSEAKKSANIYLAPDPDREGEAIAWHLYESLKDTAPEDCFYRVTYNEITKSAILAAFEKPKKINMDRVNAQQARRILDRLVGFKGSPVVRKQIRGANSVGRVQTVALRLVVEREMQIMNFNSEAYFKIAIKVAKQVHPKDPFILKLVKINGESIGIKDRKLLPSAITSINQVNDIQHELIGSVLHISDVAIKEITRKARAPFITSTLQQSASGSFGYTPKRTMGIAQKLYEYGLITYMRTDSVNIAKSAQNECRDFIRNSYGNEYIPEKLNIYGKKNKSAQEAHEAIRPTDVKIRPGEEGVKLEKDEEKLYKLIWDRFVASQMTPAKISRRTVEATATCKNNYLFRVTSSEVIFPGYMKVTGIEAASDKPRSDEDSEEVGEIPILHEAESIDVIDWIAEEKQTKPVARYSEARLIKELEDNGVGRPSTYAAIMSKLDEREYVTKENKSLIPTDLGKELIGLVKRTEDKHNNGNKIDLFEVNFTADMEKRLDLVEEGNLEWTEMMNNFYPFLQEWIGHAVETSDPKLVEGYLQVLASIHLWSEPVKSGKKIYDDKKTYNDIKEKVEAGELLSKRQGELLFKMCCRYYDQVSVDLIKKLDLKKPESVRDDTDRKIKLLLTVEFDAPRKSGKRIYDDKKFVHSIEDQIKLDKRLSDKQIAFLDKLLIKYSKQIDNFENIKLELNISQKSQSETDPTLAPLFNMMEQITLWNDPVVRGKREFNDRSFYESLSNQFKNNGILSDRQITALKKMAVRYIDQIPDYMNKKDDLNLLEPKIKT